MTVEEREAVNRRQQEFYNTKKKNPATKVWSYFRNGILNKVRKNIGVEQQIYALHKTWFGDLSQKKVLDLGCYEGNSLSYHLASHSKEYIGIDLSDKGVANLNRRIKDLPHSRAIAMDFLSEEFQEKDFDLIYAYGVLHHFKNTEEIIGKLRDKLSNNGQIITYDPLETSAPIKLIRTIYRPFQSDREWEWPFSREVYYKYQKAFEIKEKRAVLGKAKWFFMINLLPISADKKEETLKKWHQEDWKRSNRSDSYMFNCMQLTMLMQKRS